MKKTSARPEVPATQKKAFSLISDETLLALYTDLLRARALYRQWRRAARWPGCEAATAGVTRDLQPGDLVHALDGNPLPYLLTGQPTPDAATQSRQKAPGLPEDRDELQRALGFALLEKSSGAKNIAVLFFPSAKSAAVSAAQEAARAHRLPVVFVLHASDAAASDTPPRVPRSRKSLPPGTELPHIVVDAADAVAVYRVAHESIERARRDRGPTLIECRNYAEAGLKPDSVKNMEVYLRGKGLLEKGTRARALATVGREISQEMSQETGRNRKPARRRQ